MLLGSQSFEPDLDMWSLGCVAAELFLQEPLFKPSSINLPTLAVQVLDEHFALLGTPLYGTITNAWMKSLPFANDFYGRDARLLDALAQPCPEWPPRRLHCCPPQLADFVRQTLQWLPSERLRAASAMRHPFVYSGPLDVEMVANGKNGQGSIAQGSLDDEVLEYLQKCPTWEQFDSECRLNLFESERVSGVDCEIDRMKQETVGYIDANNPPKYRHPHGDTNLQFIKSERLAFFVKALRRCAKPWLCSLSVRVRSEIRRRRLPSEVLGPNGCEFMEEDFEDNAFVYVSVALLKICEREEGWHSDGGDSLLQAAVTVFGSRTLQVETMRHDGSCISLPQRPGSFYIGNLCVVNHNVVHGEHSAGSYGDREPSQQVQIVVTLRSDVSRLAGVRPMIALPEQRLKRIVNNEIAKHLAEQPFYLPDLAAVIAESREAGTDM
jgi:hypothetical protein